MRDHHPKYLSELPPPDTWRHLESSPDHKTGRIVLRDGQKLPIRFRRSSDGSEIIELDRDAIRHASAERDDYLMKLGVEAEREKRTAYTVRDHVEIDAEPFVKERATVEVRRPGQDGVLLVDVLDEIQRDPVKAVCNPAVSVALSRWRQILILEKHFTESSKYYRTAHRHWPQIAKTHLTNLGKIGKGFIPQRDQRLSVNDLWQIRSLLGSEVDYTVLQFGHEALENRKLSDTRNLALRREFVIDHIRRHAPCILRAQLPVTTLPIDLALNARLQYKRTLTDNERIIAGLAAVERCDRWEEVETGTWHAPISLVPDPRTDRPPSKVEMVCDFFASSDATHLLNGRRRSFKETRATFDRWRFEVDAHTLEKRRERANPANPARPVDRQFAVETTRYCFPHLIVEY
jgi:hypothetical protein